MRKWKNKFPTIERNRIEASELWSSHLHWEVEVEVMLELAELAAAPRAAEAAKLPMTST
jgi:hypothetical protein